MNYNNEIFKQYAKNNDISIDEIMQLSNFSDYEHQNFSEASDALKFIDILHNYRFTRKVVIDTDYDCDGVMSGVILEASLKRFGFSTAMHYPTEHDGYGLTLPEAHRILQKFPDVSLVVTADSGINCKEAIDFLATKNVSVLVSDHHKGEIEHFPEKALACVDVNRSDKADDYRFKHISGAQTAYKLMCLYAEKYGTIEDLKYVQRLRLFAAISVLSDVMLIDNENRDIVRDLLDTCNSSRLSKIAMTHDYVARLHDFLKRFGEGKVTLETFGFAVIPTINSNRRMLGESSLAFQVFDRDSAVREKAINSLMRLNDLRKSTKKLAQAASTLVVDEKFLKIAVVEASQGVLGLVASDFANKKECTSLAFRKTDTGYLTASGRGYAEMSIYKLLEQVKQKDPSIDFSFGGHSNALGCGVAEKDFDKFCELAAKVSNEIFNDDMKGSCRAIELDLQSLLEDETIRNQIISTSAIIEELKPLPYYLSDLQVVISDTKENLLDYGFVNFGRSYEHLKLETDNAEIIGFFSFEEFYRAELSQRYEFIMNVKCENRKIKCVIDKVRRIDCLQEC